MFFPQVVLNNALFSFYLIVTRHEYWALLRFRLEKLHHERPATFDSKMTICYTRPFPYLLYTRLYAIALLVWVEPHTHKEFKKCVSVKFRSLR
jgi:hypothetical protein